MQGPYTDVGIRGLWFLVDGPHRNVKYINIKKSFFKVDLAYTAQISSLKLSQNWFHFKSVKMKPSREEQCNPNSQV